MSSATAVASFEVEASYWLGYLRGGWARRCLVVDRMYLHVKESFATLADEELLLLGQLTHVQTYNKEERFGASFSSPAGSHYILFDDQATQLRWLVILRGGLPPANAESTPVDRLPSYRSATTNTKAT
ncbi:uncharacterized protein MONBRDRAFT_5259 [Monosiga brevicollis MX1]|uniref:PH domain-containing protein n=1 Tax=Monosiga brevicollis TaxID=81824 RepID=A9UQF2_MONBE|nr:uncharacterized protein MONBRDRAFT_5259 [Monosiga brevicollis MX1]EDQ93035.1 predicted protein [Monosiga brevicollis MX1]|eukprot:XP_001742797.1 hypothetical protein [Monosiga brevicollis MX1]